MIYNLKEFGRGEKGLPSMISRLRNLPLLFASSKMASLDRSHARGKYMLGHPKSGWLVSKKGELVVSDGDKARIDHFRYQ